MHPTSLPRRYFRTIVKVEVLSEGGPWSGGLDSLHDDITTGFCSGLQLESESVELTEAEIAVALLNQASDPNFLTRADELLNPIHYGDEVAFQGSVWLALETPDGEEPNGKATSNDVIRIRRIDGGETAEVFRHELR